MVSLLLNLLIRVSFLNRSLTVAANYAGHFSPKKTAQTQPIPGRQQVKNSAGGFVFPVTDWVRLDRFLVLGAEGGSYYASEQKLTVENAEVVVRCIQENGPEVVKKIQAVSVGGRAPKNSPAIFALALCAAKGNEDTKRAAYAAVNSVCRTGTHLFEFARACDQLRGWGGGLRRAIGRWYTSKSPDKLAYQVAKYQQREGWSHRDLLRLAHPTTTDRGLQTVLRWVVSGTEQLGERKVARKDRPEGTYEAVGELPGLLAAWERSKRAESAAEVVKLIREEGLVRELVPTKFLNSPEVWEALLESIPLTALIRNLGNLTKNGVIAPLSNGTRRAVELLSNREALKKARVHPLAILTALVTYQQGHGLKSSSSWTPVQPVLDALDEAFYAAFDSVVPTGKRWLLALDVSGSMAWGTIAGSPLTPRDASAALAMTTARTERNYHFLAFSNTLVPLGIHRKQSLGEVVQAVSSLPFGGTDCALPMIWAEQHRVPVDVFVTLTDSETWAGQIHPSQALQSYRQKMGIGAKSAIVAMQSNGFSLADPEDAGMLDCVGLDTNTPSVLADFVGYEKEPGTAENEEVD